MQPRIRSSNAGRSRSFLRSARPPLRLPGGADHRPGEARGAAEPEKASAGRPAAGGGAVSLDDLRRTVARIEGRMAAETRLEATGPAQERAGGGRLRLAVPLFDGLFPAGGLPLAALLELRSGESREAGPLTGFLAALAVRIAAVRRGPLLWVREARAAREAGRPAALGLLQFGFDPARLIAVDVADAAEALWAVEEGLACRGLCAVVGEVQGAPRALDLTASRRLALRARDGGVPLLLARLGAEVDSSAAAVRLAVTARPSAAVEEFEDGPGFPAFRVTVEKNRDGRTGCAEMEWRSDERRFRALAPLPLAVAAAPADRSPRPAAAGQVLAYPARRRTG